MHDQKRLALDDRDCPTPLDRAWAATRPAELSDREFDAIWTEVRRASDGPATLAFTPPRPSIGARRLVGLGLASAAALLVALVLNRPARDPEPPLVVSIPATSVPSPKVEDLKIDVDEMVIVEIAGTHVDTHRTKSDPGTTLAYLNIPADNPNDQLNHWEALAND